MTVIDALKKHNCRLSSSNRWLVFDEIIKEWVVYECKPYQKKTRTLITTESEEEAIKYLVEVEDV